MGLLYPTPAIGFSQERRNSLQAGVGAETIPNGPVRRGSREADHNDPYTRHLDPEETVLAEFSDMICDGPPTHIEEHLDEFEGQ